MRYRRNGRTSAPNHAVLVVASVAELKALGRRNARHARHEARGWECAALWEGDPKEAQQARAVAGVLHRLADALDKLNAD
jgi:hypothetical protein